MSTPLTCNPSYPEPAAVGAELVSVRQEGGLVALISRQGVRLEVRHYLPGLWELEVRYDLLNTGIERQIYTGIQSELLRAELAVSQDEKFITLSKGGAALTFEKATGAFSLSEDQVLKFKSSAPFFSHPEPVQIWEGISSLKATDLQNMQLPFESGKRLSTRMSRFTYPLPEGPVLGLPGQTGELNRKGYRFELYNTDQFLHIPGRTPMYQSWPVLFHADAAGQGWVGIFHDNPARTFVDIGDFYADRVTFESVTGNTRVYLCLGRTLPAVSSRFMELFASQPLPPAWAFGYQQCRYSYMSSAAAREVVARFEQENIPLDAIYFDIDYMDGYRVFTVNADSFGDFKETIDEFHAKGIKALCIIDPAVKKEAKNALYNRLKKEKALITDERGKVLEVVVWPGKSALPDFFQEKTRSIWKQAQGEWLARYPFDGLWNDMNEPANFRGGNALVDRGVSKQGPLASRHNLYGFHMALASSEGFQESNPGRRGVIISRSGYPGLQQFAVLWHGDNQAWWEHLRLALDTAMLYSLAGMFYTGADVPGFTGAPSDDLAVRFYQLGAFLPLYRGHSICFSKDKEPYAFSAEANRLIREAILLRYSLLREWYSGFERAIREKRAPLEPVLDEAGTLVRDEALIFDKFLFAPVVERDQKKKLVYLPSGDWYRFEQAHQLFKGETWQVIDVSIETIPLFVRAGSIVIRNTPGKTVADTFAAAESFDVYPDRQGQAAGYRFEDDGISVNSPVVRREKLSSTGTGQPVKSEII